MHGVFMGTNLLKHLKQHGFLLALGLASCFVAMACLAESLPSYPGWQLDRVLTDTSDGSIDLVQSFTLRPPDGRPTININPDVAKKLQSGQGEIEDIYAQIVSIVEKN